MPTVFSIFAGLGSTSVFSQERAQQVNHDASSPECAVLLQLCHKVFCEQISLAMDRCIIGRDVIDSADFAKPTDLLNPAFKYHHNAIIQHTTLYLQQAIRYMVCRHELGTLVGSAGACVGLLPAAAAVTGGSSAIQLISRCNDFFQVSLWIGIRSEEYRRKKLTPDPTTSENATQSCSHVVEGSTKGEVEALLNGAKVGNDVFISAILSPTRLTLSGMPERVSSFISKELPAEYRTASLAVYSLYHNRHLLQGIRTMVFSDLRRCNNLLRTEVTMTAPLLSTVSGKPLAVSSITTLEEIIHPILDLIFLEPLNWIAVQDSILLEVCRIESSQSVSIVNYGPGLGMTSTAAHVLGNKVEVRAAADILPQSPASTPSGLSWDDIAIIGMAVDLPGAPNVDLLWELLVSGRNTASEIPASRFDTKNDNENAGEKYSLKSKFGNFLDHPFQFDAGHFNISPREAKSMDPQQRVLLQTAYRALEDAGYVPDASPSFARDTFGCWIGNSTLDYIDNLRHSIDVFYSTGTLRAFLSARISYVFGWSGPSITLDTACSSSLVALHQASRAILAGDCKSALVGAVNIITSPDMYLGLDRAHFLSPSGQCKSFDTSADGYCRAEGCGVFIIKRLSAAVDEGDRIHAVIKAIGLNQSGNTHSITHPHVPTQEALFEKLLRESKIDPHEISVVEMHGTGTQAGDPNEVESVRRVLCKNRTHQNPLHLTSIKANIGHTEAVSGISGLAKLILMMKHGRIPAQISFKMPNPRIRPLGIDGAVIDAEGAAWTRLTGRRRLGMLNNFGAGGSNAAAIVGEHVAVGDQLQKAFSGITFVCGISAKSEQAILELRKKLAADLQVRLELNPPSLADVCATLTSRRQLYNYRMIVTASTLAELVDKLHRGTARDVSKSQCSVPEAIFLFTGQGSQYLGMGRELMELYSDFADTVNECDDWLLRNNYPGCASVILAERNDGCSSWLDPTAWQAFQTALFVLEVALARLLISWGIQPQAVAGHSLGEFAALVTAEVVSVTDGLKLVARRAQLMMKLCQLRKTSMLAVNCNSTLMEEIINENSEFGGITLACNNSMTDCVVGGPAPQLAQLGKHLTALGVRNKALDVPLAFHTAAVDPILQQFTAFAVAEVVVSPPKIRVVSTLLARTVAAGEPAFSGDYFAKQCRGVVAFDAGMRDLLENFNGGNRPWRWIEIGPHPSVQPMARSRLSSLATTQVLLPTLVKNVPASTTMALLLGHFYETSSGVNWRKIFSHKTHRYKLIDLPLMPFFKSEYYVPYREMAHANTARHHADATKSISSCGIGSFSPTTEGGHDIYNTQAVLLKDLIEGHVVCGYALCPASVYHDMILAALQKAKRGKSRGLWSIRNVRYTAPFVYDETFEQALRVVIKPTATVADCYEFAVLSHTACSDQGRMTVHCTGVAKQNGTSSVALEYFGLDASIRSKIEGIKRTMQGGVTQNPLSSPIHIISKRVMYELLFTRVVSYSEPYQKVRTIRINEGTGEACATCVSTDPDSRSIDTQTRNVLFTDVLLHVAGFCINLRLPSDVVGICKEVDNAIVFRTPDGNVTETFEVYCSNFDIQDKNGQSFAVADACAVDDNGILAIFKGMKFQHVKVAQINQALRMTAFQSKPTTASPRTTGQHKYGSAVQVANDTSETEAGGLASYPCVLPLRTLLAKVCGQKVENIRSETSLDALGMDSLLTIELSTELSSAGVDISIETLASCITVADVETICETLVPTAWGRGVNSDRRTCSSSREAPSTDASTTDSVSEAIRAVDMTKLVADVCGAMPGTVGLDSTLRGLGMDSLLTLELSYRLEELNGGIALPSYLLQECYTVGDIERLVNKQRRANVHECGTTVSSSLAVVRAGGQAMEQILRPSTKTASSTEIDSKAVRSAIMKVLQLSHKPEVIQTGPKSPYNGNCSTLFLVHDGSGLCSHYRRLKSLNRRVLALHDPKFLTRTEDGCSWASLSAMVAHYASVISATKEYTANETCILAGWSFGGVVAFEIARILLARGSHVKGVILIDAPPPLNHVPLSDAIISAVTAPLGATAATSNSGCGDCDSPTTAAAIRKLVTRSFKACARLLAEFEPITEVQRVDGVSSPPMPCVTLLRAAVGWAPPQGMDGQVPRMTENPWLQDRRDHSLATAGWEALIGRPLECVDIPGNHFQVFDPPNIEAVSAALASACLDLESRHETV